jgi:hypothetical protein
MLYLCSADEKNLQISIEALEKILELFDGLEMDVAAAHISAGLDAARKALKSMPPGDMGGIERKVLTFRR